MTMHCCPMFWISLSLAETHTYTSVHTHAYTHAHVHRHKHTQTNCRQSRRAQVVTLMEFSILLNQHITEHFTCVINSITPHAHIHKRACIRTHTHTQTHHILTNSKHRHTSGRYTQTDRQTHTHTQAPHWPTSIDIVTITLLSMPICVHYATICNSWQLYDTHRPVHTHTHTHTHTTCQ